MKLCILIALLAAPYCYSFPDTQFKTFRDESTDEKFRDMLEDFKTAMKNGVPWLQNKTLDPLKVEEALLNIYEDYIIDFNVTIANLLLENLSEYDIKLAKFSIIGFEISTALQWPEIRLHTDYDLNGIFGDQFPIYGTGKINALIRDLYFKISCKLDIDEYLQIKNVETAIDVEEFEFNITGLYYDEIISEFLSAVVSGLVPDMMKFYQSELVGVLNKVVEKNANAELKKVDVDTILDAIMDY